MGEEEEEEEEVIWAIKRRTERKKERHVKFQIEEGKKGIMPPLVLGRISLQGPPI